jgi:hypothetical protein
MPTKPRLMAATPDDEDVNSLIGEHADLLANRAERRLAVVEFYVAESIDRTDGEDTAKVKVVHWETVPPGADHDAVEKIRNSRARARVGSKKGTPLDGIDDSVDDTGDKPAK